MRKRTIPDEAQTQATEPEEDTLAQHYQLMTIFQVAELLQMSPSSIYNKMRANQFPRPRKVGNDHTIRFLQRDVFAWIEALPESPTLEEGVKEDRRRIRRSKAKAGKR